MIDALGAEIRVCLQATATAAFPFVTTFGIFFFLPGPVKRGVGDVFTTRSQVTVLTFTLDSGPVYGVLTTCSSVLFSYALLLYTNDSTNSGRKFHGSAQQTAMQATDCLFFHVLARGRSLCLPSVG